MARVPFSIRPSRIHSVRAVRWAMAGSWVTTTTVVPSACTRSNRPTICWPVAWSSSPVGSSASSSRGRLARARAMATRCASPPESCDGR